MGRMQRRKGAAGERDAAKAITEHLGIPAHRGRQYHGGSDAPDVAVDLPGVHVEVKRTETFSAYKAMEQAEEDADGKIPVVLHRKNGKKWLAVVSLDRLMELAVKLFLTKAGDG